MMLAHTKAQKKHAQMAIGLILKAMFIAIFVRQQQTIFPKLSQIGFIMAGPALVLKILKLQDLNYLIVQHRLKLTCLAGAEWIIMQIV